MTSAKARAKINRYRKRLLTVGNLGKSPHWRLLKRKRPVNVGKASPETMHWFSEEAEQDLIETDLELTLRLIADLQCTVIEALWDSIEEEQMEKHRDRVGAMKVHFFRRRTGLPF